MAVVFIARLIFVVFDANKVAVYGLGVQGESHKCVDCGCLDDNLESLGLEFVNQGYTK